MDQKAYLISQQLSSKHINKKWNEIRWTIIIIIFLTVFGYVKFSSLLRTIDNLQQQNQQYEQTLNNLSTDRKKHLEMITDLQGAISLINVCKNTLLYDLKTRFPGISEKAAKKITDTIIIESEKYDINPVILYAIGIVESSHRYWIEHNEVTIKIPDEKGVNRSVKVRAVGWGGIIWEWHHKILKKKKIASSRSDLFQPEVNIRATAMIYNMFRKETLLPGIENSDISAQRRYFGGNYRHYSAKIDKQIVELMKVDLYRKGQ